MDKKCCLMGNKTCAKAHKILGRVLFGLPLAVFGVFHFINTEMMAFMVPSYMPAPTFWVYFTGAAMIVAALAILAKKFTHLAGSLLGVMLVLFVLMVHLPATLAGDEMAMMLLLKDLMIAGGAFYMAGTCMKFKSKKD